MSLRLSGLHRKRQQILADISQRRQRMTWLGRECHRHGRAWAKTPSALVQAFLAGFLLDQARPLLPGETSPLKLAVLFGFRRLEAFIRQAW